MSIRIYYDITGYRLRKNKEIIKIIERVIRDEMLIPGDLSFVITTDIELQNINKEFLRKDYYTDVIAFDYGDKNIVAGEVYISWDTVERNANNYKVSLRNEMLRVIIHGTLHLCGYNDETGAQKDEIRRKEDRWLKEFYRRS